MASSKKHEAAVMEALRATVGTEVTEQASCLLALAYEVDQARARWTDAAEGLARDLSRAVADAAAGGALWHPLHSSRCTDLPGLAAQAEAYQRALASALVAMLGRPGLAAYRAALAGTVAP